MLVSNTSTLVLLAKIDSLEQFIQISPIIEIPRQVMDEALVKKESYYANLIKRLIDNKKIVVVEIDDKKLSNILREFHLDYGEAAAFAMFDSKKHKAILTDDGELIKLCKLENIQFICAMAIIIELLEKGKLSKNQALEKLEELYRIGRYSRSIYDYFVKEVK